MIVPLTSGVAGGGVFGLWQVGCTITQPSPSLTCHPAIIQLSVSYRCLPRFLRPGQRGLRQALGPAKTTVVSVPSPAAIGFRQGTHGCPCPGLFPDWSASTGAETTSGGRYETRGVACAYAVRSAHDQPVARHLGLRGAQVWRVVERRRLRPATALPRRAPSRPRAPAVTPVRVRR